VAVGSGAGFSFLGAAEFTSAESFMAKGCRPVADTSGSTYATKTEISTEYS
jgi:hypothetical protein